MGGVWEQGHCQLQHEKEEAPTTVKTNRGSKSDISLCMDKLLCTSWGPGTAVTSSSPHTTPNPKKAQALEPTLKLHT